MDDFVAVDAEHRRAEDPLAPDIDEDLHEALSSRRVPWPA